MIQIVIGANFGDEGKGLMTDYFCRFPKSDRVLNVRMNGGAQAGHTVVTPTRQRWEFAGIGAGSFNRNVDTYLSRQFLVNPYLLETELHKLYESFQIKPKVFVDCGCALTTLFDMAVNQLIEDYRGTSRHGSCGFGVFETWHRSTRKDSLRFPLTTGKIKELLFTRGRGAVADLLLQMQHTYIPARLHELGITKDHLSGEMQQKLFSQDTIELNVDMLQDMFSDIALTDATILDSYDHIVFEGAQGLSLDMDNQRYFPHLTPSKTGLCNVFQVLEETKKTEVPEVCFVTRSYMTRHGAGELNTECSKEELGNIYDKTNLKNQYQGTMRFGKIEKEELKENISKELALAKQQGFVVTSSLCVTHLDQTGGQIAFTTGKEPLSIRLKQEFSLNGTLYYVDGETAEDVHRMETVAEEISSGT